MLKPFLEYLKENVVVCDGAMGTQLYSKGVFINRCFDELNLSRPEIVREVHQEYLWAGAEILETNTFGANSIKLEPHGLRDRVGDINRAGVRLAREVAHESAYVGGSVGPLGIRVEPYGKLAIDEARAIFAEQVRALTESGVDLLCLETFADLNELRAAILAVRDVCSLPLIAQVALSEDGNSLDGTPPEQFGAALESLGADVIGLNCGVGPQVMLESLQRLAATVKTPLAAQPNAGKPRSFEGRNLYLSSPDYMANYARRFIRAGVQVVGGCCGTTPAHIKAIREAVHTMKAGRRQVLSAAGVTERPLPGIEVPVAQRSRFARLVTEGSRIVLAEIVPPEGGDPAVALEAARRLKAAGTDGILVAEAPRASFRMSALALAVLVEREAGINAVLHYTARDRNLHGMQTELLGAHALGLQNLLVSTGEPIRRGEFMDATSVYEVDSIGLTQLLTRLNAGRDLGEGTLGRPTGFFFGVTIYPASLNPEEEIRRLEYKVEAGAHFAVTEPVFDPELLESFLRRTEHCRVPVIAGIHPLSGQREAEFLSNEVASRSLPASILARMAAAGPGEAARAEGLTIAREIIARIQGMVQGILVTAPVPEGEALVRSLAGDRGA